VKRAIAVLALGVACGAPVVPTPAIPAPVTLPEPAPLGSVDVYRDGAFLVGSGGIPFVGLVRFAATQFLDSTSIFIGLSIPPRSLSFIRAGDRYAAFYTVRMELLDGGTIVRSELPSGEVRVANFSETTRGDEGLLFQRILRVAPGAYSIRLAVHDSLGAATGTVTAPIIVPTLRDGAVAQPIPVFAAEPRTTRDAALSIVANPRATIRYGRDTVMEIYVEGYGLSAPDTIVFTAFGLTGNRVAADTVALPRDQPVRAAIASFATYRLGLGPFRIVSSTVAGVEIDTATGVVSLGIDVPVTNTDDLLASLRYFASEADLQQLRAATPAARPHAWSELLRRMDPVPASPENEAFVEYARRLRVAAAEFAEGSTPGWKTDRGAVLAALGEPDSRSAPLPADSSGVGRVVTWEYRRHHLVVVFNDLTGSDHWRLSPVSNADFRSLLALSGLCLGCR
jgi:GWxTD domain-containing protein